MSIESFIEAVGRIWKGAPLTLSAPLPPQPSLPLSDALVPQTPAVSTGAAAPTQGAHMSDLSVLEKDVAAGLEQFFSGLVAKAGPAAAPQLASAQQAASAASSALQNAENAAEAGIPAAATIAVDAVLGLIPGGATFDQLVNPFVTEVVAQLIAKVPGAKPAS